MKNISCCGADCGTCGCFGSPCIGCNECQGRVFHAPEGKACPIYACAMEQKRLRNCGDCKEVPCTIWQDTRDPQYSDEEFQKSIEERIKTLRIVNGKQVQDVGS